MRTFIKDAGILLLLLLIMALIALMVHVFKSHGKQEYVYLSRGILCEEYNKDNNTLLKCNGGELGEVEILNPISVIKLKKP